MRIHDTMTVPAIENELMYNLAMAAGAVIRAKSTVASYQRDGYTDALDVIVQMQTAAAEGEHISVSEKYLVIRSALLELFNKSGVTDATILALMDITHYLTSAYECAEGLQIKE